jgi:uncharacterized protein YkwD
MKLIAGGLACAALASAFTLFASPAGAARSGSDAPPSDRYLAPSAERAVSTSVLEERLLGMVASERGRRRLGELTVDPDLTEAARRHSEEMDRRGYFDHYSPTRGLRTPIDRYSDVCGGRPRTTFIGENIYYAGFVDVRRAHQAFMESTEHRANVLRRDYRHIGIGIHTSRDGQLWVTEMFSD